MIEKAIRKHIHIYNDRFPNKSLDEFIAAVKAELEMLPILKVTEENFGDLLIEGMEQALDHAKEDDEV